MMASDNWRGRLWVAWKMFSYDPVHDPAVPTDVRQALFDERIW